MIEKLETDEVLSIKSQIYLIAYMIRKGIIKTAEEYVDRGFAEAFCLLKQGVISCPEIDWEETKRKANEAMNKFN